MEYIQNGKSSSLYSVLIVTIIPPQLPLSTMYNPPSPHIIILNWDNYISVGAFNSQCHSYPCKNDGTCHPRGFDGYSCECRPGDEGPHCEYGMLYYY